MTWSILQKFVYFCIQYTVGIGMYNADIFFLFVNSFISGIGVFSSEGEMKDAMSVCY